ncbi:hypothetical protein AVEN_39911-1 [Araneus ventricosus]|uniref:Uncharacterized protein n=1 Tax=Araneus ventricosus TaxID=182803 RepID=A0A4Y2TVT7_ARAVE|nr:hypothetical protein AVEN_257932-1 [Araneus ventricosus]GBO04755.1 hypothetical protein AVEN_39911-1 [Araneus ventricosus]
MGELEKEEGRRSQREKERRGDFRRRRSRENYANKSLSDRLLFSCVQVATKRVEREKRISGDDDAGRRSCLGCPVFLSMLCFLLIQCSVSPGACVMAGLDMGHFDIRA